MKNLILSLALLTSLIGHSTPTLEERIDTLEKKVISLESQVFKKHANTSYSCTCELNNKFEYSFNIKAISYPGSVSNFNGGSYLDLSECKRNLKQHIACKK